MFYFIPNGHARPCYRVIVYLAQRFDFCALCFTPHLLFGALSYAIQALYFTLCPTCYSILYSMKSSMYYITFTFILFVINFSICACFILRPLCPTCYSRRADRAHTGVSLLRLCDQNLFRTTKAAQSQSVKQVLLSCTEAECGRVLKGSHKGKV